MAVNRNDKVGDTVSKQKTRQRRSYNQAEARQQRGGIARAPEQKMEDNEGTRRAEP